MRRKTVRVLLISIAALWIMVSWALISGAIEPSSKALAQPCIEDVNCPTPSGTTAQPSGTGTSRPPGGSPTGSPSPSGQPSTPPGQMTGSPSPTDSPSPSSDRARTRVTIDWRRGEFLGRVRSRVARCERGRRVILKRETRGEDVTEGTTKSNRRGGWQIAFKQPRGRFYAIAKAKTVTNAEGDTSRCRKGESKTIRP